MLIQIGGLHLSVSPLVLGCVAAGVAVALILLIVCCCCWCCRRKNDERGARNNGEIPHEVKGNQDIRHVQPRMAEHNVVPRYSPPAPPSRQPPRHSPTKPPTPSSPASSLGSSQIMFTYQDLVIATNGFSKGNILGEGGFGSVHKGMLPSGKEIAVKSLKSDSKQGEREFRAEVETVSRVHHRHLVSLVGYCNSGNLRLLVYELVPNKTLEFHLHGKGQPEMDWPSRMKVAIGAAKGLAYLHESCHPRIIHRDIKAANILLDNNFEAKVADFGLAKFYSMLDTHVSTRVMGTLGYLAPEYASSGKLTAKSDVYSFGVLLLELITGRKPFDKTREVIDLVEWARPLLKTALEEENFNSLVDPLIQYCFKHTEMSRMVYCVATCVRTSARRRPQMSMVVRALEGNMPLTDLSEGIIADISTPYRADSESEYSESMYTDSTYKGDSRGFESTGISTGERFISGEHDGTTSEYGLYASTSGTEGQSTQEIDTAEMRRVIIRSQRPV